MRNITAKLQHMKLVVTEMDGAQDQPSLNLNEVAKNKDAFQGVTKANPHRSPMLARTSRSLRAAMNKNTHYPFIASPDHMPGEPDNERLVVMLTELEAKAASFTLASIDISNFPLAPQIGPSGAHRLAAVIQQSPNLQSLTIVDTGLVYWREIALALQSCPLLQRVDFSCNRLDIPGNTYPLLCISLQHHMKLTDIDFSECNLGQRSTYLATACRRCPALTKLNVASNRLSEETANTLINTLPACHNLQHLNLSSNAFRDTAHAQTIGYALRSCTALTHLDLSCNYFDSIEMTTIALDLARCTTLRHLSLRKCVFIRTRGFCSLAETGALRLLTSLDLSACDFNFPDPAGVQTWPIAPAPLAQLHTDLAQCTNLTRLDLAHNRLGDRFLDGFVTTVLPACTALAKLDLEDTEIRNVGTRRLARIVPRITNLVDLNLSTNNLTAETIADMRQAWIRTHAHAHGLRINA